MKSYHKNSVVVLKKSSKWWAYRSRRTFQRVKAKINRLFLSRLIKKLFWVYVTPNQVLTAHRRSFVYVLWWYSAAISLLFRLQRPSLDTRRRLYFQQFFNLHRHRAEYCDIVRYTKKFICSKDIENIDVESCCFWCCCWCIRSTSFHIIYGHLAANDQS